MSLVPPFLATTIHLLFLAIRATTTYHVSPQEQPKLSAFHVFALLEKRHRAKGRRELTFMTDERQPTRNLTKEEGYTTSARTASSGGDDVHSKAYLSTKRRYSKDPLLIVL